MKRMLLLSLLLGCTRKEPPKMVAEVARDAAVAPVAEAAPPPPPASPFTIFARGPAAQSIPHPGGIAGADPVLQRLPNGGIAFGAEHVVAHAEGPGPLTVDPPNLEVLRRPAIVQGAEAVRWVWMSPELSVFSIEEAMMRTGSRIESHRQTPKGWEAVRGSTGWWSATRRGDAVLALQRSTYEVPHSSIYLGDDSMNMHALTSARIAVLAGKATAPVLPKNLCATAMASGPDEALVVTLERCGDNADEASIGVLRYAPGASTATLDWVAPHKRNLDDPDVFVAVGGANAVWVAASRHLAHWDGKAWSVEDIGDLAFHSLSAAPDGTLWAVKGQALQKRAPGETAFTDVPLPLAPADRLDDEPWATTTQFSHDVRRVTKEPPEWRRLRAPVAAPMKPIFVDATLPEVLVLGELEEEVFALSTTPRTPVARIPSLDRQRALVAQTMKRKAATGPTDCRSSSFLVFPDGTTPEQVHAGGVVAGAIVGEAIVEGKKRLVLVADDVVAAAKTLASLKPTRLCDPVALEKDL